jgi:hypothetical protein
MEAVGGSGAVPVRCLVKGLVEGAGAIGCEFTLALYLSMFPCL